jgi:hypothetical protein
MNTLPLAQYYLPNWQKYIENIGAQNGTLKITT